MLTIILRLWFSVHPQLVSSFCVRSYSWNNRFIITFVINKTIIFIIVLEVSQLIHISPHASNRHQIKRVYFSICIACISLPWAHFVCVCVFEIRFEIDIGETTNLRELFLSTEQQCQCILQTFRALCAE